MRDLPGQRTLNHHEWIFLVSKLCLGILNTETPVSGKMVRVRRVVPIGYFIIRYAPYSGVAVKSIRGYTKFAGKPNLAVGQQLSTQKEKR
ncbi:MAG: hypothetical protein D3910_19405 [Candidatus Electrothrix sp. ATG2]|nr:hypothetical protein [Candidatus Electrothrix sp. ATG2]